MAQDTKRQSADTAAPSKTPRLNEMQRIKVLQLMRKIKDRMEELNAAMKVVKDFVYNSTMESNQDHADFEEALDTLRDGAKEMAYAVRLEKATALVLESMPEDAPSIKVKDVGTASRKVRNCWSITDMDVILRYALANKELEAFTASSIREAWCNNFYDTYKKVPPGCKLYEKPTLSFVKPRQKVTK